MENPTLFLSSSVLEGMGMRGGGGERREQRPTAAAGICSSWSRAEGCTPPLFPQGDADAAEALDAEALGALALNIGSGRRASERARGGGGRSSWLFGTSLLGPKGGGGCVVCGGGGGRGWRRELLEERRDRSLAPFSSSSSAWRRPNRERRKKKRRLSPPHTRTPHTHTKSRGQTKPPWVGSLASLPAKARAHVRTDGRTDRRTNGRNERTRRQFSPAPAAALPSVSAAPSVASPLLPVPPGTTKNPETEPEQQ